MPQFLRNRRCPKAAVQFVLTTLLVGATGCYHVTYSNGRGRGPAHKSGTNHFFIAGLVNTAEVDLAASCPAGVDKLDVHQTFVDGFLGSITLGIYTPRSWSAWCTPAVLSAATPASVPAGAPAVVPVAADLAPVPAAPRTPKKVSP